MIEKIKQWAGVVALVAIVLVGVLYGGHSSSFGSATLANVNGGNYVSYNAVETTDGYFVGSTQVIDALGNYAASGATTISVNGVTKTYARATFTVAGATTTPCALATPAASSTIDSLTFNITTATSTAMSLTFSTSTTAYATTSNEFGGAVTVSSGVQAALAWHPSGMDSVIAASPATFIVVGAQGGGFQSTGFKIAGTCTAVFSSVN